MMDYDEEVELLAEIDRLRAELQRKDDTIDRVLHVCYNHEFETVETRKVEEAVHGCGACRGCDRLREMLDACSMECHRLRDARDGIHDVARIIHRAEKAEARLAAVIALCDSRKDAMGRDGWLLARVRATATGDTK